MTFFLFCFVSTASFIGYFLKQILLSRLIVFPLLHCPLPAAISRHFYTSLPHKTHTPAPLCTVYCTVRLHFLLFFLSRWCQASITPCDTPAHTPCLTRERTSQFFKLRDEAHGLSSKKRILTIFMASNADREISWGSVCVSVCVHTFVYAAVYWRVWCWRTDFGKDLIGFQTSPTKNESHTVRFNSRNANIFQCSIISD